MTGAKVFQSSFFFSLDNTMSISTIFTPFCVWFQLFGITTLDYTSKFNNKKCIYIWQWTLLCIIFVLFCFIWANAGALFSDDDPIGTLTDMIQVMVPFCVLFIVILEGVVTGGLQEAFVEKLNSIDEQLRAMGVDLNVKERNILKPFLVKVVVLNGVGWLFELLIIVSFYLRGSWIYDWTIKLPAFSVNRFSDCHYMLLIDCLRIRIECLNELIREFTGVEENRVVTLDFHGKRDVYNKIRVKQLKQLYEDLYILMQVINKRMAKSILATITSNFIELTINLYWVYAYLHVKIIVKGTCVLLSHTLTPNLHIIISTESYYYPIPRITLFMCLFYTCENCWRQIRLIKSNVSSIIKNHPALVNSVILRRFVMQVQQSPITLSANQLFVIDYEALFAVSQSHLHLFHSKKCVSSNFFLSLPQTHKSTRLLPQISCTCSYLFNLCLMLPKYAPTTYNYRLLLGSTYLSCYHRSLITLNSCYSMYSRVCSTSNQKIYETRPKTNHNLRACVYLQSFLHVHLKRMTI